MGTSDGKKYNYGMSEAWMLELLAPGGFLVVLLGSAAARLVASRRRRRLWRAAVPHCGLTGLKESWLTEHRLTATAGDLRVRLVEQARARGQSGTLIVVERPECAGVALELRPEGFSTGIARALGAREHRIGDFAFDTRFFITDAAPTFTAAFLEAATRAALSAIKEDIHALMVAGGEIRVYLNRSAENAERFPSLLARVLEIARRMPARAEIVSRLSHNARHDPQPAVREYNLAFIADELRREPGATDVLRAALADEDRGVRLRAAVGLGEEGYPVLLEIALSEDREECVAEAISALGARLPADNTLFLFSRALMSGRAGVALACIPNVARIGNARAEAALIDALKSRSREVRLAAAAALGRTGSTVAIAQLKVLEQSWGDIEVTRAAHEAIANIHLRAGATPGQLSLTEGAAGQVSLADAGAGRLSLPKPGSDESV
jgi:HEAT repeat protein